MILDLSEIILAGVWPEDVVVEPDVGVAVLLQPRLVLVVAVRRRAGLDGPEVAGDPSAEVVDVVKLNIHHPVSVSLGENFHQYLKTSFIVYKTENTVRYT